MSGLKIQCNFCGLHFQYTAHQQYWKIPDNFTSNSFFINCVFEQIRLGTNSDRLILSFSFYAFSNWGLNNALRHSGARRLFVPNRSALWLFVPNCTRSSRCFSGHDPPPVTFVIIHGIP